MKRLLLACFLLTATCAVSFVNKASAQMTAPTPVTLAEFTTKINQLDAFIAAGDMTNAQAKWTEVHTLLTRVLGVSKYSIYSAPTPADKTAHETIAINQQNIYWVIWGYKTDLATNRVAIHNKLVEFGATIY